MDRTDRIDRSRRWVVPLLSLALIGSLVWGYQQFQAREGWETRTENQYNRAFTELSANVDGLESQLAKAMVSNSPPILMRYFSDIWRQAQMSQNNLGQLPLASVELATTKSFLAKVGAYTYDMAVKRDLRQKPLSEKEWETLRALHRQASFISGKLYSLQEDMMDGTERWLNVDRADGLGMTTAVERGGKLQTNKVTKSFLMMEDGLKRLPDPDFEGNMLNFKEVPRGVTGDPITVEQGRTLARRIIPNGAGMRVRYDGRIRGDLPTFMYSLTDPRRRNASPARIALTVKGGHLAWMLKERAFGEARLSLDEARRRASAFVASRGYPKMTSVSAEALDGIAVVAMACVCDGYIVYPNLVKVQVALDTGEIMGVEAIPFLTFHQSGKRYPQPKLGQAAARKKVNPHLKVEKMRPAVILDDRFKEVACWEAVGTLNKQRFRVYINAVNGQEEKIQRVNADGVEIE